MIRLGFSARLFIIFVTSLVALQLLAVMASRLSWVGKRFAAAPSVSIGPGAMALTRMP